MTTIYINKMKAAETGMIEIRFAYEKTVLHYLKRFFKDATWNADEKVWLVSASDEISMELFLKATREWCEISITEPKAEEIEEIEFTQCAYCAYEDSADNMQEVPTVDDDAAWEALADKHADDCEWVNTRAHRIEAAKKFRAGS